MDDNNHMKRNYSIEHQLCRLLRSPNTGLSDLTGRAEAMLAWQEKIRGLLPAPCRPHCYLAAYRNGTLYLQSNTSAWATRIRMQQRGLMMALKQHPGFEDITRVVVKVRPQAVKPDRRKKARTISAASRTHIKATAQDIDDQPLREALEQLTRHQ